jgi:hypothetical protein
MRTVVKASVLGIVTAAALMWAGTLTGTAVGIAAWVAATAAFADWNPAPATREWRREQRVEQGLPPGRGNPPLPVLSTTIVTAAFAALALLFGEKLDQVIHKDLAIFWFVVFGFAMLVSAFEDKPKPRSLIIARPSRSIPQDVKIAVSVRDGGRCRRCGSDQHLQYDHIVPYSKGGSSTDPDNIQLLCGYHNRLKSNR